MPKLDYTFKICFLFHTCRYPVLVALLAKFQFSTSLGQCPEQGNY